MTALVHTLIDHAEDTPSDALTPELRECYDGELRIDVGDAPPAYVVTNFVTTLDGIVSYKIPGQAGGSPISGADQSDRFIMGLLRASVDAVIIGSGTLHDAERSALWTAEEIYPAAAALYGDYRRNVLKRKGPAPVAIVSASGELDLERAVFQGTGVRVAIITTAAGRERLIHDGAAALKSVEIHVLDATQSRIPPRAILGLMERLGLRRLLLEGGPRLLASFLADGAVDELFLTLSPQIAGRNARSIRPALIEGVEFLPGSSPWFELLSAKRAADHLYLRYRYRRSSRDRSLVHGKA